MTESKTDGQEKERQGFFAREFNRGEDRWEMWAKIGVGMAVIQALLWIIVFLRLGMPSVYAHAVGVSMMGALTIPIAFWGLVRMTFNPPVLRRTRTIGFGCVLLVGLAGNVPFLAVPLSTEGWESKHDYRLPFDGEWMTIAGGDKKGTNYHATTATFRWGYDFAPARDGKRFEGDGSRLEDYHCFGEPVLAPAGGRVVEAVGYLEDVVPGEVGGDAVLGNHVVIRVDADEYLYVAHMKNESVTVKDGDEISVGQKIGECGNSGRTVAPHVHVHLQNSTNFPLAESLPLRFSGYEAGGALVNLGMPTGT
ncbi:MAG: M23 family metallopeptidase, partial [Bradymonadaceae bacterium]